MSAATTQTISPWQWETPARSERPLFELWARPPGRLPPKCSCTQASGVQACNLKVNKIYQRLVNLMTHVGAGGWAGVAIWGWVNPPERWSKVPSSCTGTGAVLLSALPSLTLLPRFQSMLLCPCFDSDSPDPGDLARREGCKIGPGTSAQLRSAVHAPASVESRQLPGNNSRRRWYRAIAPSQTWRKPS